MNFVVGKNKERKIIQKKDKKEIKEQQMKVEKQN